MTQVKHVSIAGKVGSQVITIWTTRDGVPESGDNVRPMAIASQFEGGKAKFSELREGLCHGQDM